MSDSNVDESQGSRRSTRKRKTVLSQISKADYGSWNDSNIDSAVEDSVSESSESEVSSSSDEEVKRVQRKSRTKKTTKPRARKKSKPNSAEPPNFDNSNLSTLYNVVNHHGAAIGTAVSDWVQQYRDEEHSAATCQLANFIIHAGGSILTISEEDARNLDRKDVIDNAGEHMEGIQFMYC